MSLARRVIATLVAALLVAVVPPGEPAHAAATLQEVMFVGNNWDGTVDVINSHGTFSRIGRINVVPDRQQRLTAIYLNPIALVYYLGIQSGQSDEVARSHELTWGDMVVVRPGGAERLGTRPQKLGGQP